MNIAAPVRSRVDLDENAPARPGRSCPAHYRYAPSSFARDVEVQGQTLYVAGGLYGNTCALERILEMADGETGPTSIVFNGDFNWFDTDSDTFEAINRAVRAHVALRGNVETEIAGDDGEAGCGCAYPESVSEAAVARSNSILERLRETARTFPATRAWLGALPMHCVAQVAGVRIAIVHGDAGSLAGWAYSERALARPEGLARVARDFGETRVRVIASSHTCLPVAVTIDIKEGTCALFNNGAAGMPNFRGTRYGVVTRISTHPARRALYGARIGEAYVDALAVDYDHARWIERFLGNWPEGSAAHASYFTRMIAGPDYDRTAAMRGAVSSTRDDLRKY